MLKGIQLHEDRTSVFEKLSFSRIRNFKIRLSVLYAAKETGLSVKQWQAIERIFSQI